MGRGSEQINSYPLERKGKRNTLYQFKLPGKEMPIKKNNSSDKNNIVIMPYNALNSIKWNLVIMK